MEFEELEYVEREAYSELSIITLAHLLSKMYDEACEKIENSFLRKESIRFVLAILSKREGITQNELSKISHLNEGTISVTIASLENEGFVRKVADRYDHRAFRIYLTDKGRELNEERVKYIESMDLIAKYNTTSGERKHTIYVLKTYVQNLITDKSKNEQK